MYVPSMSMLRHAKPSPRRFELTGMSPMQLNGKPRRSAYGKSSQTGSRCVTLYAKRLSGMQLPVP